MMPAAQTHRPCRPASGRWTNKRVVRMVRAALQLALCAALWFSPSLGAAQAPLPLFDAHLHYSHDAWERLPPKQAVALMRQAGLTRAMVSSSSDEGTQLLYNEAPDLVLPVLRPYRTRGEIGSWVNDSTVVAHLEQRLAKHRYVAIGEYHVFGADADGAVVRRVVQLARQHGLALHSHSDADAIERQFKQDPQARILWAHAGFDPPDQVRDMLRKHPRLNVDLAYRSDHAPGGKLDPAWRAVMMELPDRFLLGTDTFTSERWYYVGEHARLARQWLGELPRDVAERIAHGNGERLFGALAGGLAGGLPGSPVGSPARALPAPGAQLPCTTVPAGAQRIDGGPVQAWWWPEPSQLQVGQPFVLMVSLCPAQAQLLRVDAHMPEHRHGMNYRPTLQALGAGRWRADGLLWHMPGRWEWLLDTELAAHKQRLVHSVVLR